MALQLIDKADYFPSSGNRIEQSSQQASSRLQVYQKKVDPQEEGVVVDMAQFETGNKMIFFSQFYLFFGVF